MEQNIQQNKKTFDGYEFVELAKNSALANGTVQEGVQQITYVYKKKEVTPPVGEGHKVTHEFKSGTAGKELPEEVLKLLPKDQPGKVDGNTVIPKEQNSIKVQTADGTWTFEGYDENSKNINKSDVTFEVKWKFTPNKHEVIHKFVSKDPNKELPKEVTDILPTNQTGIVKGDEVRILFFCEFF